MLVKYAEEEITEEGVWAVNRQGVRRMGTSHELRQLHKTPDLLADIKRTELKSLGHMIRISQTGVTEHFWKL